jgi:hypothetical protein
VENTPLLGRKNASKMIYTPPSPLSIWGSSWSKEIPILKNAGHQVIAVQLSEYSLADDPDVQSTFTQQILPPLFNILITYY